MPSKSTGLYDPTNIRDACGMAFIAHKRGVASRDIVQHALNMPANLQHRGAVSADAKAGDGAGILTQIPQDFFRRVYKEEGITLPSVGSWALAYCFMPQCIQRQEKIIRLIEDIIVSHGHHFLGYRYAPVEKDVLGDSVKKTEPSHVQIVISAGNHIRDEKHFSSQLFALRYHIDNMISLEKDSIINRDFYVVSLSPRTVVYKGMVLGEDLSNYYLDLQQGDYTSALALAHMRFSTNTLPSWRLAHPYRMLCHNGEINTVKGNVQSMRAREGSLHSPLLDDETMKKLTPLIKEGQSDTASIDNMLDILLHCGGYSLHHAMVLLMPPPWEKDTTLSPNLRAFYQYHAERMEPWDGPAAIIATDGITICAAVDRNGLRPARYWEMDDDIIVLASEAGVLRFDQEKILQKKRLHAGSVLVIDTSKGICIDNATIKKDLASQAPYLEWIKKHHIIIEESSADAIKNETTIPQKTIEALRKKQQQMGYTLEDIKFVLEPMTLKGGEPTGSMGDDTPKAILTEKQPLVYDFFRQRFAQVTNPAIDSLREFSVMSLRSFIGPRGDILSPDQKPETSCLCATSPILTDEHMKWIHNIGATKAGLESKTLQCFFRGHSSQSQNSSHDLEESLKALALDALDCVENNVGLIILSDCKPPDGCFPIPILLALSFVHQTLVKKGLRTRIGLIVETNEAREIHHFCCLSGYGAEAIYPPLALMTARMIAQENKMSPHQGLSNYKKALDKGILKVMSKMGIATYYSYCGSGLFDAVGLSCDVTETYFLGTYSALGGIDLTGIAHHAMTRYQKSQDTLEDGGVYAFRVGGERHVWSPTSIRHLQHATRSGKQEAWDMFTQSVDEENMTIRSFLKIIDGEKNGRKALPLEQVESIKTMIKRFSTGAMSYGSISKEAHTTLALAMNELGGKSNTGEGGEESERFQKRADGRSACSAIKQVASGRFGVTPHYLLHADMLQIKIAQGAKPGEGGQLPNHKVNVQIARVRHSTPGVGLISPPTHHDIYSIEDLEQLIFDLKNVNPDASVSVKLVSERGVGTIAAGVAKAKADHITIAGADGGTGASPLNSIYHAGNPWELGLAEAHQTLIAEGLREQVSLQVDGGLRTPSDVVKAALLGADEFGFSIAPLIATGCLMMRKCHLNTCPVGIATQDERLRAFYTGTPEHVIAYFTFLANGVRSIMSQIGVSSFHDLIGQTQWLLVPDKSLTDLDFSPLLHRYSTKGFSRHAALSHSKIEDTLDCTYLGDITKAFEKKERFETSCDVHNMNRSIGTRISGLITRLYGEHGAPEDHISLHLKGCAGQSFGAFLTHGVSLNLEGEANDYVGKGMHGGRISILPTRDSPSYHCDRQVIIGNTVLYGATGGEAYFAGEAGERFAIRNSGTITVVEGMGDHGCEYMTAGIVLCLGVHGRNAAAGMSGGIAYFLDEDDISEKLCNKESVQLLPLCEPYAGEEEITFAMLKKMEYHLLYDHERIRCLLERHIYWTKSLKAKAILEGWNFWKKRFFKIVPNDYQRAILEEQYPSTEHKKYV